MDAEQVETDPIISRPDTQPVQRRRSNPLTTIIISLLIFQAIGFGFIAFYVANTLIPHISLMDMTVQSTIELTVLVCLFFAFFALLAAITFLRYKKRGWFLATLLQAASLLIGLILYFTDKPPYPYLAMLYLVMLYSSVMVLYLNYYNLQTSLRSGNLDPSKGEQL